MAKLNTRAIYVLLALAAVVAVYLLYGRPVTPVFRPSGEGGATAVIFVPGNQGKLEKKTIEVQKQLPDKAKADAMIRELKEGRSIPDRLRLYEMAVGEDGVLYLNFSKEFFDPGTPAREVTMVYSIVNSFLASFPRAKRVQLLVEGAPVYTRSGFLYILEPLEFNKELLED
jgi:spore germination protein GerM